ncbi:MAG: hypothetical protein GY871_14070 [Actinomycetales bacterium]|nr:hypothetical protein [Actinomycetales bacterium]
MSDEQVNDYRADEPTPESATPGADASMTTEAMAGLQEVQADPLADDATRQNAHERAMFERYVKENGQQIPENFESAGAWFDSLKGAQAQFTQSQQEVADLKRQYQMADNTNNPDYVAPEAAAPVAPEAAEAAAPAASTEEMLDELRIPDAPEEPETPEPDTSRPTDADYARWTSEVQSTGALSEDTRAEIRAKTGFSESMINDFLTAQQAKRKEAFTKAAEVVGSGAKLSKVLRWASTNYSGAELNALQQGLAGPSAELTLRGLAAAYDSANPDVAEPQTRQAGAATPAAAQPQALPGYKSMQEYRMDMSNPRFKRDDKFRMAVEERASRTDWRTIK